MQTVNQLIHTLYTNPWFGVLASFCTIFSFLLAFYFYKRSRRTRALVCVTTSTHIIDDAIGCIPRLTVLYDGVPVNHLTITTLAFWNAGSETIDERNLVKTKPLCLALESPHRYMHIRTYPMRAANDVKHRLDKEARTCFIDFEFLDHNDGFVMDIIHTGEHDTSIRIDGVFKGCKPLERRSVPRIHTWPWPLNQLLDSSLRRFLGILFLLLAIWTLLCKFFLVGVPSWLMPGSPPLPDFVNYIGLTMACVAAGVLLLRIKTPPGFDRVFAEALRARAELDVADDKRADQQGAPPEDAGAK
jgi:hypothetical protein